MLSRRTFLSSAALPLLAAERRPNVLLFTTDQESALLPADLKLPNRRRLTERGAVFDRAFCNTPQCSPARSSLLTGLEPHHSGTVTNVDAGSLGLAPSPALPSLGSVFQKAGYATGFFGKWHLGAKGPSSFGFETAESQFGEQYASKTDDRAAHRAAEWIRDQKGPWMAWVSLINPHDIYYPPEGYEKVPVRPGMRAPFSGAEALAGKPEEQKEYAKRQKVSAFSKEEWLHYRSFYCELLEKSDACLGTVLDAAGTPGSCVIAYSSDHGDGLGEHSLPYKGPFMYEELVRIPLILSAPSIRPGVRHDFATQADILPTLAGLAGIAAPAHLDGISLTERRNVRDAVLLEYCGQQQNVYPIRTIRTTRWKLNWYDSGGKELYDLERDPHEITNLAGTAEVRSTQNELEARLTAWRPSLTEMERQTPGRYLRPRGEAAKRQEG